MLRPFMFYWNSEIIFIFWDTDLTDHCPILPPAIIFVLDQSGVLFESGKVLNVLHSACSLIVDVSRVCPISTQHCPNPFPLSRRHRTHPQHRHHQLHNKTIQHNNKHHYNHRQPPQGNTLTKIKTHEFSNFVYSRIWAKTAIHRVICKIFWFETWYCI